MARSIAITAGFSASSPRPITSPQISLLPAFKRPRTKRLARPASPMACAADGALGLLQAARFTIDFAFDDADTIEEQTLFAVIGRWKLEGGDSIVQQKSILKKAGRSVFIVAEKQYTRHVDGAIPVVIKSGYWLQTAEEIDDLFLGDAEVWRRPSVGHADPLGGDFPFVTREGHHVLDVIFTSPILNLGQVAESLDQIEGVVDHGIIHHVPCRCLVLFDGVEAVDSRLLRDPVTDS